MDTFFWILTGGVLMSGIALVGGLTLLMKPETLDALLLPLVALAAGSLIGGAFFHMLPVALSRMGDARLVFLWVSLGLLVFMALEQFMHWRHCRRRSEDGREPVTYLILVADAVHNLLGGMAVAGVLLVDTSLGIAAWVAAAMHEIPQELGDFGVMVHGGWRKGRALVFNFLSGSTFLVGGLFTYYMSTGLQLDTDALIAFGAGNFIYIGASDLIPRINRESSLRYSLVHFGSFAAGLGWLYFFSVR